MDLQREPYFDPHCTLSVKGPYVIEPCSTRKGFSKAFSKPKGSKVLLWGIPSQTIIVIPNIETLHSTI